VHPDPDRLFKQADTLINSHKDETDLRRAMSAAYYGVFHFMVRAAADLAGAQVAVSDAQDAVKHFQGASVEQREAFLTLLLFRLRDR
jgi:hypothetical protein